MAAPPQSRRVDLAQQSLARLLFELLVERFTGTVEIGQPGAGGRTMRLRGGMPVWFDWSLDGTRLAELLAGQGMLDGVDIDAAIAAAASAGRRTGELLRERELAGHAEVLRALREQCLRRCADAFRVRSGTATVIEGDDREPELLQVNVLQVVHRGVSETYDVARVRDELGPELGNRFRAAPAFARHHEQFKFRAEDTSLLAVLLAGKPTDLAALARLPGASEQRAAQLLYVLHVCRMMAPADAPQAEAADAPRIETPVSIAPTRPSPSSAPARFVPTPSSAPRPAEPRTRERKPEPSTTGAAPRRKPGAAEPHALWSGAWPTIWIVSAVVIVLLLVSNLLVRSDW